MPYSFQECTAVTIRKYTVSYKCTGSKLCATKQKTLSNIIQLKSDHCNTTQIIGVHRITSPDKCPTLAVTKETTSMEMVKNGEMEEKRNWTL